MKTELIKRIITSIILTGLSIFFLLNGSTLFLYFLSLILFLSIREWYYLSSNSILFFFGTVYLILSFILAYILKIDNLLFLLFVILISVFSDIGGFVFGKFFKGPKLTKISPNKTYAGTFGSFILSLISGYTYVYYNNQKFLFDNNLIYFNLTLIILSISLINQIGDLVISYFKRLKNLKNTGNILPGHGGLLDRIDGIIFTVPCSYCIYKFFL
jgi:phosphatidate cytidylyltransferase